MKFLVVFALAFSIVSAKDLYSRLIEVPVLENEGRIINGNPATPGQLKYQVGISLRVGVAFIWCGGSLIGKNWILSSAHYTVNALSGTVFLGTTKLKVAEKQYDVKKDDIITHPEFDLITKLNDISLIRIPTTSESSKIAVVRISSRSDKYVGNVAVVSGWGYTSDTDKGQPHNLQWAMVKVSSDSLCSGNDKFHGRTNICVDTSNGVSSCFGDSGDPLVLEIQSLQIGVFSFGVEGGCTTGLPDVYTNIGMYHLWIKSVTGITGVSKL